VNCLEQIGRLQLEKARLSLGDGINSDSCTGNHHLRISQPPLPKLPVLLGSINDYISICIIALFGTIVMITGGIDISGARLSALHPWS
jgi:hypothetical protein